MLAGEEKLLEFEAHLKENSFVELIYIFIFCIWDDVSAIVQIEL